MTTQFGAVVVALSSVFLFGAASSLAAPTDAGGGPVKPKPVDVLVCRGNCATDSISCIPTCSGKPDRERGDCYQECTNALNRCLEGCGPNPK